MESTVVLRHRLTVQQRQGNEVGEHSSILKRFYERAESNGLVIDTCENEDRDMFAITLSQVIDPTCAKSEQARVQALFPTTYKSSQVMSFADHSRLRTNPQQDPMQQTTAETTTTANTNTNLATASATLTDEESLIDDLARAIFEHQNPERPFTETYTATYRRASRAALAALENTETNNQFGELKAKAQNEIRRLERLLAHVETCTECQPAHWCHTYRTMPIVVV